MNLIISTLPKGSPQAREAVERLDSPQSPTELVETDGMRISHCVGCNDCWIKTPGRCCIRDDYEPLLRRMLDAGRVLLLAETRLGFVSHQAKNFIDRVMPLATMHLKIQDGQMRHYSRYGRMPDLALLYDGEADREFLGLWLSRVQLNLHGKSLGAYPMDQKEELYHAFAGH